MKTTVSNTQIIFRNLAKEGEKMAEQFLKDEQEARNKRLAKLGDKVDVNMAEEMYK